MTTAAQGIYCNRTLNLRSIKAIGYDMDYTLVHYHVEKWERRAYEYLQAGLDSQGWPVADLEFDPAMAMRGLIIDAELGNVIKADRFGYVKRAHHGTAAIPFADQRRIYGRIFVDLRDRRWLFLNTLFAISECCMFMQLVDLRDQGLIPGDPNYADLYLSVRHALDGAHAEGKLKAEIIANPEAFVDLDAEMPLALLDQKRSGKKILLITNSEWDYAAPMLEYAFDRFLPGDMTWRDLVDYSLVSARKPNFFSAPMPVFEVVDDDGLLREHRGPLTPGGCYVGGNAALVEKTLGLVGEQILYVGDHVFVDVNVSKSLLRWRTAVILRELEDELAALAGFAEHQEELAEMMATKTSREADYSQLRLGLQRARGNYGPKPERGAGDIEREMTAVRDELVALDERIAPLARDSSTAHNQRWGLLLRTGNDKSHLARQVERYADVYTSRVSNFLHHTPYVYLRAQRGSMPHDPGRGG